ncbi:hypothetical protein KKB83_05510 [Patescibacteria group bacterium]|nr:hypothetical protein [Patescibacteria group bacterium]
MASAHFPESSGKGGPLGPAKALLGSTGHRDLIMTATRTIPTSANLRIFCLLKIIRAGVARQAKEQKDTPGTITSWQGACLSAGKLKKYNIQLNFSSH